MARGAPAGPARRRASPAPRRRSPPAAVPARATTRHRPPARPPARAASARRRPPPTAGPAGPVRRFRGAEPPATARRTRTRRAVTSGGRSAQRGRTAPLRRRRSSHWSRPRFGASRIRAVSVTTPIVRRQGGELIGQVRRQQLSASADPAATPARAAASPRRWCRPAPDSRPRSPRPGSSSSGVSIGAETTASTSRSSWSGSSSSGAPAMKVAERQPMPIGHQHQRARLGAITQLGGQAVGERTLRPVGDGIDRDPNHVGGELHGASRQTRTCRGGSRRASAWMISQMRSAASSGWSVSLTIT